MADKLHRTTEGETWDLVSKKYYGTEKLMHKLLEANPEFKDFVVFPAGVVLKIPEVEIKTTEELPPWRK